MTATPPWIVGVRHEEENFKATLLALERLKEKGAQTITVEQGFDLEIMEEIIAWIKRRYDPTSKYHNNIAYETILGFLSRKLYLLQSYKSFFGLVKERAEKMGFKVIQAESKGTFKAVHKMVFAKIIEKYPNTHFSEKDMYREIETYPAWHAAINVRDRDMTKRYLRQKTDVIVVGAAHAAHLINVLRVPDEKASFISHGKIYPAKNGQPTSWRLRFALWKVKRGKKRNEKLREKQKSLRRARLRS